MIREFVLTRTDFTPNSTIGELTLEGKHICYILEDVVRAPGAKKVPGQTAIPYGRYQVIISKSNRFSRLAGKDVYLPELLNVQGFAGIRIHSGNDASASEGCLITGTTKKTDWVSDSRIALGKLQAMLKKFLDAGDTCYLTVTK